MAKISANYLNDPEEGLDQEIIDLLDEIYFAQLPNREVQNPKVLIVFSGGNAAGKSTLAHAIETELHGLVLENDAIKTVLKTQFPDWDKDALNTGTWQYSMSLYKRLPALTRNGLVVRDGVIDWYYDRILPIFLTQGYKLFVVGYDISREKNEALIMARGDKYTVSKEFLLGRIAEHEIHMARFRAEYPVDIMLTDKTIFDHDSVIRMIRERL